MIRSLFIALAGLLACLHAETPPDLLRFSNGDQLHGSFAGIAEGPKLIWKRDDLGESAKFDVSELRHLVMRGGHPAAPLKSISMVGLANGDQIPGVLTALSDKEVTIETSIAGTITLERNKVASISPQPLGGRLHYHGPFSENSWEVRSFQSDGNAPQQPEQEGDEAVDEQEQAQEATWQHSGATWYWGGAEPGTALILRDMMPEKSTLRFDIAWKNQLNLAIALHADFQTENKEQEKAAEEAANGKGQAQAQAQPPPPGPRFHPHDTNSLPSIFGNAFVLQMQTNYMVIYRTIVDKKGQHSVKRIQTASNRLHIGERSTTSFELRSDLQNSTFSLFANGKFVTQWTDPARGDENIKPLDGGSLAFMPRVSKTRMKLTDIIIAEWNGMPDSARSLQTEDQDVIVMTNGLDRFAGKAIALEQNQMLRFRGRHGELLLPMDEISELHMATGNLLRGQAPSGKLIKARFSPMGVITGSLISGDRKSTVLHHQLAGDITINNDAAVMLEFKDTKELFTDWDANF